MHQVQRAIEPVNSLQNTIENWSEITQALADTPRERVCQLAQYYEQW